MRSSGSTPSRPPDGAIRLYLFVAGDDAPIACTGRRLLRRSLAQRAGVDAPVAGRPILLDPYVDVALSAADRAHARRHGVLAIDCSWNGLSARGGFPELAHRSSPGAVSRRLPWLLATNAQHYGRWGQLTTAEALGAALDLLGEPQQARTLLEGFAGGESFFTVNAAALERYGRAESSEAVLAAEQSILSGARDSVSRPAGTSDLRSRDARSRPSSPT